MTREWRRGDRAYWHQSPRGGYCNPHPAAVVVCRPAIGNRKRVRVMAALRVDGRNFRAVFRSVHPERLSIREEHVDAVDAKAIEQGLIVEKGE